MFKEKFDLLILITITGIISTLVFSISSFFKVEAEMNSINKISAVNITKSNIKIDESFQVAIWGDMSFVGLTAETIIKDGADPFQFIKEDLKQYEIKIGNLETNISEEGVGEPQPDKAFTFNSPLESIDRLVWNELDAVSLANNHTMDYGADALINMLDLLDENNIKYFGAGTNSDEAFAPNYISYNDLTIGLIGVNEIETFFQNARTDKPGSAWFDENRIKNSIKTAKQNSDFVIVMPHWGIEHVTTANWSQENWGRKFIDFGADLVVGAHPHVRQNTEKYNGKEIHYSLGNFIFSGFGYNPEAEFGSVLVLTFDDGELKASETLTVKINYHGFPEFVD